MATKPATQPPPVQLKTWNSAQEIDKAVAKLNKRLLEVEQLDARVAKSNRTGEDKVVLSDVKNTILEIFGEYSPEYREHQSLQMWSGSIIFDMPQHKIDEAVERGRLQIVNILKSLIKRLSEKREELAGGAEPTAKAITQYLNLHPRIADVASDLFEDGYHWEAIFSASKALINYVKERSGRHDLDGTGLVRTVFSKNAPILAFNALKEQTDIDEQEGMMHLFEGVVLGIRNPGGHSFPEGPQQRATEYLSLISLLAYRTQEAKKTMIVK